MDPPNELTLIEEDLHGPYESNTDCPLARALMRVGVTVNAGEGYMVSGHGEIVVGVPGRHAGRYEWEDGTQFRLDTLRTGTLVLQEK